MKTDKCVSFHVEFAYLAILIEFTHTEDLTHKKTHILLRKNDVSKLQKINDKQHLHLKY